MSVLFNANGHTTAADAPVRIAPEQGVNVYLPGVALFCPLCRHDAMHIDLSGTLMRAKHFEGDEDLCIWVDCEEGHRFGIAFIQHKGTLKMIVTSGDYAFPPERLLL